MLQGLFEGMGPIKHAFVVTAKGSSECTGEGFVAFRNEADAKKALEKIQGKQIMDRRLKVSFAKHRKRKHALLDEDEPGDDTNAKVKTDVATATAAVAGPPQIVVPRKHSRGRLIVRNLSFKAKEEDLRKAFGPYGKLKEVSLAKKQDGSSRGFGFVEFDVDAEAMAAMEKVNATEICGRQCAVDYCLPKNDFVQQQQLPSDQSMSATTKETKSSDAFANNEDIIKLEGSADQDSSSSHGNNDGEKDEDDDVEDDNDDDDNDDDDNDDDDNDDDDEGDEAEDKDDKVAPSKLDLDALRAEEAGRNVFVQNMPFEATKRDVYDSFGTFGKIEKVNLVMDKTSGRPRGTCFVIFKERDAALKCLQQNRREALEDFRSKVCGRTVWACEVLPQREVRDVSSARKRSGQLTKDVRNLHLADVGRIDNNSGEVWKSLSQAEQSKRLHAIRDKAEKLKNPNFSVSATRLSVRNLPKDCDELKLKQVFSSGKKGLIRQAKIVKDDDGQSKGFGFVEFKEHDDALKALHRVNNSAHFFGKNRPIVEFAVDDARKIALRNRSQDQQAAKVKKPRWEKKDKGEDAEAQEGVADGGDDDDADEAPRKMTKQEKVMRKKKAQARVEIKQAKKAKREAKRAKMREAGADDDLEVLVTDYMGRKKARIDKKLL